MKISPITPNFSHNKYKSPNIQQKTLEKGQFYYPDKIFNSDYTQYARDDINWQNLGRYLKLRYPDIKNVDIKLFACSTGEEAYTMAILLKHLYGNIPFKIDAMDIDEQKIKICKSRKERNHQHISKLSIEEMQERLDLTQKETEVFFAKDYETIISPDILKLVDFKKANILTSLDLINSNKPTLLLARNMWPYVNSEEYKAFAQDLYNKMSPKSTVIIGGYDIKGSHDITNSSLFPNALYRVGFNKIYLNTHPELDGITRRMVYEKD